MKSEYSQNKIITCGDFSGETEEVNCPICSPERPNPDLVYSKENGVNILKCPSCELMYASPRFTEESLLKIYETPAFINSNDYAKFENWSYDDWTFSMDSSYVTSRLKTALVSKYLGREDTILDVGCSMGLFCLEASKQGFKNVEGLEPSSMLSGIGQNKLGVSIHNTSIETFTPEHLYQGIVLWDVLEHVYDPVRLLIRCNEISTENAYLFLQVPNYFGISDRWKTFLCRKGLKKCDFKHFGFPWHVYSFNRKSLSLLLNKTGYEPLKIESWSHTIKEGRAGSLSGIFASFVKKRCLSDYITCVAQKK